MIAKPDHTYNLDVERAALSVVLDGRHQTAWDILTEHVSTPLAFYDRTHRIIYLAAQMLAAESAKIDVQSICQTLAATSFGEVITQLRELEGLKGKLPARDDDLRYEDSALAAIGGMNPVTDLSTVTSVVSGLPRNCKLIAEHYHQRQMIDALAKGVDALRKPGGHRQAPIILDETLNACLAETLVGRTAYLSSEGALAAHDLISSGVVSPRRATFGIAPLDEALTLRAGELWTLAGDTGCGKTSLLLHALTATSEAQGPGSVAICSQEMGRDELAQIYIARRLRIPRSTVADGRLSAGQREMASEVQAWLDPLKIAIRDSGHASVKDVATWAQSRKRVSPNLALLAVDYLGLLKPTVRGQSEYERLTEATRTLKQLARDLNVTVLLLAQMSREARKRERGKDGKLKLAGEPQSGDLKGSGSIEDDSDGVVILWRPTDDDYRVQAKVTKCRAGKPPRVDLGWVPHEGQRFASLNTPDAHSSGQTRFDRMQNSHQQQIAPFGSIDEPEPPC